MIIVFLLFSIVILFGTNFCLETQHLDAVMLTTGRLCKEHFAILLTIQYQGKDTRVFTKSVLSALEHLVDVYRIYVLTPKYKL